MRPDGRSRGRDLSAVIHGVLYSVDEVYMGGQSRHYLAEYEHTPHDGWVLQREAEFPTQLAAADALRAIVWPHFPWLAPARAASNRGES